jgi:hypothetical protein
MNLKYLDRFAEEHIGAEHWTAEARQRFQTSESYKNLDQTRETYGAEILTLFIFAHRDYIAFPDDLEKQRSVVRAGLTPTEAKLFAALYHPHDRRNVPRDTCRDRRIARTEKDAHEFADALRGASAQLNAPDTQQHLAEFMAIHLTGAEIDRLQQPGTVMLMDRLEALSTYLAFRERCTAYDVAFNDDLVKAANSSKHAAALLLMTQRGLAKIQLSLADFRMTISWLARFDYTGSEMAEAIETVAANQILQDYLEDGLIVSRDVFASFEAKMRTRKDRDQRDVANILVWVLEEDLSITTPHLSPVPGKKRWVLKPLGQVIDLNSIMCANITRPVMKCFPH